jgi:hypothetical protein
MRDLDRWDVRGPVRTLRATLAEWNPDAGDWHPARTRYAAMFRPDGQVSEIDHCHPDGSGPREVRIYHHDGRLAEVQWRTRDLLTSRILHSYDAEGRPLSSARVDAHGTMREAERCRYDAVGRKTKVVDLPTHENGGLDRAMSSGSVMYAVDGSDISCAAPGATTSTTAYDERGLPTEVSFHDAHGALIRHVVLRRDRDGRVLSERLQFADGLLATIFPDHTPAVTTYAYDEKGRRLERRRRMGQLSDEKTRFRYDDDDNPVEEITVEMTGEMRLDDGAVTADDKPAHTQYVRFEYQYDPHRNWIERVAWTRSDARASERRCNIERRTITYYGG